MFSKSRLAAARISGITILSTAFGHILVFVGLFWLEGGSFSSLEPLPPLPVLFLAIFLTGVIVLLSGWTLTRFIYQQDDHHFSRHGVLRWSIFGLVFGGLVGATTRWISRPSIEFLEGFAILIYLVEMGVVYGLVFIAPGRIKPFVLRWVHLKSLPSPKEKV